MTPSTKPLVKNACTALGIRKVPSRVSFHFLNSAFHSWPRPLSPPALHHQTPQSSLQYAAEEGEQHENFLTTSITIAFYLKYFFPYLATHNYIAATSERIKTSWKLYYFCNPFLTNLFTYKAKSWAIHVHFTLNIFIGPVSLLVQLEVKSHAQTELFKLQ